VIRLPRHSYAVLKWLVLDVSSNILRYLIAHYSIFSYTMAKFRRVWTTSSKVGYKNRDISETFQNSEDTSMEEDKKSLPMTLSDVL